MSNRPLSPHLQTYRLPLLPLVSILNRGAGVALAFGTLALTAWLVALGLGEGAYAWMMTLLTSPIGIIALIGWTLALTWHAANGVRHLIWDMGHGLGLATAERSAYAVIAFSIFATTAIWIWIWSQV